MPPAAAAPRRSAPERFLALTSTSPHGTATLNVNAGAFATNDRGRLRGKCTWPHSSSTDKNEGSALIIHGPRAGGNRGRLPARRKGRGLDCQTPPCELPSMEILACRFKLPANASEGRKQFPVSRFKQADGAGDVTLQIAAARNRAGLSQGEPARLVAAALKAGPRSNREKNLPWPRMS